MWPSSQDAEIAKQSIEKAAKLGPTSSNAREALGDIKASNWDRSGAEQDYRFPKTAERIRRAFSVFGYQGAMQQWAKELEVLTVTKQLYAPVNLALAYAILELRLSTGWKRAMPSTIRNR
jgi:hypothetical protein